MRKSTKQAIKAGFIVIGVADLAALYLGATRLQTAPEPVIRPEAIADISLEPLPVPGTQPAVRAGAALAAAAVAQPVLPQAAAGLALAAKPAPAERADVAPASQAATRSSDAAPVAHARIAKTPRVARTAPLRPLFERAFPHANEVASPAAEQQDLALDPVAVEDVTTSLNGGELPPVSAPGLVLDPIDGQVASAEVPLIVPDTGGVAVEPAGAGTTFAPDASAPTSSGADPAGVSAAAVLR